MSGAHDVADFVRNGIAVIGCGNIADGISEVGDVFQIGLDTCKFQIPLAFKVFGIWPDIW